MSRKNLILNKGAYLLVLYLPKEIKLKIGSLGRFTFKKGYYCYVGSAMRNLTARIERHLKEEKKCQWHIDYLRQKSRQIKAIRIESDQRLECRLNHIVATIAAETPVRKFGSSDCSCFSHLHFFEKNPEQKLINVQLRFNDADC